MPVPYQRRGALVLLAALAACSGHTTGSSSFVPPALVPTASAVRLGQTIALAPAGIKPAGCPSHDITCLTVSYNYPAQYRFCFIGSGSNCYGGPYTFSSTFRSVGGSRFYKLKGVFTPNPGNPSTDEIIEKVPLASSNGAVRYQQTVWACQTSGCLGPYHIGVITE